MSSKCLNQWKITSVEYYMNFQLPKATQQHRLLVKGSLFVSCMETPRKKRNSKPKHRFAFSNIFHVSPAREKKRLNVTLAVVLLFNNKWRLMHSSLPLCLILDAHSTATFIKLFQTSENMTEKCLVVIKIICKY